MLLLRGKQNTLVKHSCQVLTAQLSPYLPGPDGHRALLSGIAEPALVKTLDKFPPSCAENVLPALPVNEEKRIVPTA